MSFKEQVAQENLTVFCNLDEFAEERSVLYDGEEYENVPCVMTKTKAKDRNQATVDHAQGLYLVTSVFHCPVEKLDGNVPEKGSRIDISDDTGFMRRYYVAQSGCEMGMIRLELEAYDE